MPVGCRGKYVFFRLLPQIPVENRSLYPVLKSLLVVNNVSNSTNSSSNHNNDIHDTNACIHNYDHECERRYPQAATGRARGRHVWEVVHRVFSGTNHHNYSDNNDDTIQYHLGTPTSASCCPRAWRTSGRWGPSRARPDNDYAKV